MLLHNKSNNINNLRNRYTTYYNISKDIKKGKEKKTAAKLLAKQL